MRAEDALKFISARLTSTTHWVGDAIAGSGCDGDHELELDVVDSNIAEIRKIATRYGHPNRYSDGRAVVTRAEIEPGFITEHIWHPDVSVEPPSSWTGALFSGDPDLPSPGVYEVSTDPVTQSIHVQVVRTT